MLDQESGLAEDISPIAIASYVGKSVNVWSESRYGNIPKALGNRKLPLLSIDASYHTRTGSIEGAPARYRTSTEEGDNSMVVEVVESGTSAITRGWEPIATLAQRTSPVKYWVVEE